MKDKKSSSDKWYKDLKLYIIVIGSCLSITIILILVNLPARFKWLILDSESSNIGSAIGGVGTVVVGILNAIMLYLTFKRQSESLELEKDKLDIQIKKIERRIEDERKNNQYRILQIKFNEIRESLSSKKIILTGKECSINNYFLLNDFNDIDSKIMGEEILETFSRLKNILEELSKIDKESKNDLFQEITDFYKNSMQHKYDVIIIRQDEAIKRKLQIINGKIETYIRGN